MKYYKSQAHDLFYYVVDEKNDRYYCSHWKNGWKPLSSLVEALDLLPLTKLEARLRGLR